ncbi:hypothetical protein L1987_78978 [Smallanthus sonchifolius]|uniref:Uncharacterized protein n=1 Tax=Smallanthus sonchifolius TaxID=185202 RepID=A0ACB8ZDV5_9ASTR|nr:hypothetical protein L1987_78978 [Smallanthus sonchifolius]
MPYGNAVNGINHMEEMKEKNHGSASTKSVQNTIEWTRMRGFGKGEQEIREADMMMIEIVAAVKILSPQISCSGGFVVVHSRGEDTLPTNLRIR